LPAPKPVLRKKGKKKGEGRHHTAYIAVSPQREGEELYDLRKEMTYPGDPWEKNLKTKKGRVDGTTRKGGGPEDVFTNPRGK